MFHLRKVESNRRKRIKAEIGERENSYRHDEQVEDEEDEQEEEEEEEDGEGDEEGEAGTR